MDLPTLAAAYDRSAPTYDARFRELQRTKFRALAAALAGARMPAGLALDAGAGTALFAEWLATPDEPEPALRRELAARTWLALDASPAMLQLARARPVLPVVADLARPPLRPGSCALVAAFTSLLERVPESAAALSSLLQPGGLLVASFLRAEAPASDDLVRWTGLRPLGPAREAGQDLLFILGRPT